MPASPAQPDLHDELARLHEEVVNLLQSAVPPPQGLPYIEGLLRQAKNLNARWEYLALHLLLAHQHTHDAHGLGPGHALHLLEFALVQTRQLEDAALTVRVLSSLGSALHQQGRYAEALVAFTECVQLASGLEDPYVRFLVLNNTATFHLANGSYLEGLELLEQARQAANASGNTLGAHLCLLSQVGAHNRLGHHQQALDLAGDLQDPQALPPQFRLLLLNHVITALNGLAREPEALARAQAALALAGQIGNSRWRGDVLAGMAQTLLQLGRLHEAVQCARTADELMSAEQNPEAVLDNQRRLFTLYEALGDPVQALHWLKRYQQGEAASLNRLLEARSTAFAVHARVNALEAQAATERRKNAELSEVIAELHRTEDALKYQSTHDPLTGLHNRVSFQQRAQVLLNTLAPLQQAALFFIDLDHFKDVNDLYGHAAGDDLLRQVAQRLQGVRAQVLAGRIGGDEFVLLVQVTDAGEAAHLAGELLRLLTEPFHLRTGDRVETSGSVGVALAPQDGQQADVLQHRADQAMYASKHRARREIAFYSTQLGEAREARLRLENDLRQAVPAGELRLHYQARYQAATQALQGFEALVRWERPGQGLLGPQLFIPVAEQSQLMLTVGSWVLQEACRQAVRWNLAARDLSVAVNVSVMQFQQPHFLAEVQEVLSRSGCPPRVLNIELTETVILKDLEQARVRIEALRELGVQVSMDDFGTGYSSLSVLRNLPLNFLKIDRSFMQGIRQAHPEGRKAEVMLATLVDLAHQFDMRVTAEGVETREQLAFLTSIGCDSVQGFLLGRPESVEHAARRLSATPPGLPSI